MRSATGLPAGVKPDEELGRVRDRLTTTFFLAALFHGIIIIGVSFASLPTFQPREIPTLEVLLLADQSLSSTENANAPYLAQRGQEGGGTTAETVAPTTPESSLLPLPLEGTPEGTDVEFRENRDAPAARELLATRSADAERSYLSGVAEAARDRATPMESSAVPPAPVSASAADETFRLRARNPRELVVAADTRESIIAGYLDAWKRKVERLGTINYPLEARRGRLNVNPVLEVTIRADGSLAEALVRRSSGHREIDQAAINILRLAAPFDPFPDAVRKDHDTLRFAYEWQFIGNRTAER